MTAEEPEPSAALETNPFGTGWTHISPPKNKSFLLRKKKKPNLGSLGEVKARKAMSTLVCLPKIVCLPRKLQKHLDTKKVVPLAEMMKDEQIPWPAMERIFHPLNILQKAWSHGVEMP